MFDLIRSMVNDKFVDAEITVTASRDGTYLSVPEEGKPHIVFPVMAKNFHFVEIDKVKVKHNPQLFPDVSVPPFMFENMPVAKVKGTDIFLLFSCGDDGKSLVEQILSSVVPKALEAKEDWMKGKFRAAMALAIEQRLSDYRKRIEENEEELESVKERYLGLVRQIHTDKEALSSLDGTKGQWLTKAEKEFASLKNLVPNTYRKIFIEGDSLVALTNNVEMYYVGTKYEFGEFEIRIRLHSGDLKIQNLTNKVDDCDHPHIKEGRPCLGNIGPGVIKMISEFELFGVLQMLNSFLHSYTRDSYLSIDYWDPTYEGEKRYEECHEDHSGFACVECGDRNCPFYDDAFEVCLEDSTLEDCINCEYQCDLGRQRIREEQRQESEVTNG